MAEPDIYNSPQRLVEEMSSSTPQTETNPSKLYSHFPFRPLFIAIFIALLPLFPSEAPGFINQSIPTRSWELLHLLFVGIAVSYGLFSRRNIEFDKESNQLKFDTAQSYVSRILEVSSVFDDEVESLSHGVHINKTQIWNSQYSRGESMVKVTKERSGVGKCSRSSHGDSEKPLLLPVRSLKLHVSDVEERDSVNGNEGFSVSSDGSSLADSVNGKTGFSASSNVSSLALDGSSVKCKMGNGVPEIEGWDFLNFESSLADSVNGKTGFSVSSNVSSLALDGSSVNYKMGNGVAEIEGWDFLNFEKLKECDVLPSPISRRSQSGRTEFKNVEGTVRPLPCSVLPSATESEFVTFESPSSHSLIHQSPRQNSSSSPSPERHSPVSPLSSELHAKNWEDFGKTSKKSDNKPSPFPSVPVPICAESPPRTANANLVGDVLSSDKKDMRSFRDKVKDLSRDSKESLPTNKAFGVDSLRSETKPRRHLGKSVRTIRARKYAQEARKCRENMDGAEVKDERRSEEVNGNGVEKTGASIEKPTHDVHLSPPRNHQKESAEGLIGEPKDSDSSYSHESSDGEVSSMGSGAEAESNANEVDKKADEFIAKFKEQIRLQGIEAIKRSGEQRSRRDSR